MNKNLHKPSSKSVFNYTVLLDDLIEPLSPAHSTCSFDDCSPKEADVQAFKLQMAETQTREMTVRSDRDTDLESPIKPDFVKSSKCERLRKSDGALPWAARVRHSELKNFLTDESDDEEPLRLEQGQWGHVVGAQSGRYAPPRSKFSLSSCFKHNFSQFGQESFMESKLNLEFPLKNRRKKLKTAMRGRHFERVLARLSIFVENGEASASLFF